MKLSNTLRLAALLAVALLLCVGPATAQLWGNVYQFYPSPGYYNNATDYYLMTDSSSATYATTFRTLLGFPVNFTPLLANCLAPALRIFNDDPANPMKTMEFMPSLYYVTNAPTTLTTPQYLVFSAEWPVPNPSGSPFPRYAPKIYMPVWRLQLVTWNNPATATTLRSEAAILAAQVANQVTITDANVAIGATILINSQSAKIPQAVVLNYAGQKLVRLPIRGIYVGGQIWKMIQTDFSNPYAVVVNRGAYAPWLNRFNELRQIQPAGLASQIIYSFWPQPPIYQLYLATQRENPIGPSNANANYSPLMNEWQARALGVSPIYTDATAVPFLALQKMPTNYLAFQPVVGQ